MCLMDAKQAERHRKWWDGLSDREKLEQERGAAETDYRYSCEEAKELADRLFSYWEDERNGIALCPTCRGHGRVKARSH